MHGPRLVGLTHNHAVYVEYSIYTHATGSTKFDWNRNRQFAYFMLYTHNSVLV